MTDAVNVDCEVSGPASQTELSKVALEAEFRTQPRITHLLRE